MCRDVVLMDKLRLDYYYWDYEHHKYMLSMASSHSERVTVSPETCSVDNPFSQSSARSGRYPRYCLGWRRLQPLTLDMIKIGKSNERSSPESSASCEGGFIKRSNKAFNRRLYSMASI